MVQMTPADQAIVKALPGNNTCADCPTKNPQWASVSFGNVFCLECSGVHRSLGVHISFVRSIAMDSWTDKQLALMKNGGNDKCNEYLKSKGIQKVKATSSANSAELYSVIKAKYESDAGQLYKEVLKARVEGRPEPTQLTKPTPRTPTSSAPSSMNGHSGPAAGGDPNGMERLAGETDQQYIARQTRLKEEARARMAAKFGGSNNRMGGVGSSSMQGIGSNPNYTPGVGYGGAGSGIDLDGAVSSVTNAFSSGLSMVSSVVNDEQTRAAAAASVSNISTTATAYGGSFWNSLKSTVNDVAVAMAQPDGDDGLAALQREFESHKPAQSKYAGFGSSSTTSGFGGGSNGTMNGSSNNSNSIGGGMMSQSSTSSSTSQLSGGGGNVGEAPGLPGEDRNGVERLTGETDDQYVVRQTRLRDEAKARMAAKFGGGGLSSAGPSSSSSSYTPTPTPVVAAPTSAPQSYPSSMSLGGSGSGGVGVGSRPAVAAPPSSGGLSIPAAKPAVTKMATPAKKLSSDDFFAEFGT